MDAHRKIWPRVTLRAIGILALSTFLAGCGEGAITPPVDEPVVSAIRVLLCRCSSELSPERTIGILGTQVWMGAEALAVDGTVLYTSAQNPDRFSWSSSAPDIAAVEVSPYLHVTGVSEGTAIIAVTSEGATGEMTVTVRDHARLAWSVPLSGESINADVAIGPDGTIYVVTFGGGASRWFAVSPQGSVLWTLDLPDSQSTPAIGADGTLYGGLADGGLIAVSPGGTVRWTLWDLAAIRSSPAIGPDGTIYAAGHDHVYAVDPQGEVKWVYETTDKVFAHSSPAVASDGTIHVGGSNGLLYAIDPDGSPRWTFDVGDKNIIYSGPSIDRDGTIYFGGLGGLYAVGPDGSEGGMLLGRTVQRTPSIGRDGTIYVGVGWASGGIGVYAVDSSSSIRWRSAPGTYTTPILGANGTVYVTGTDPSGNVIAALDSQGKLQWDYRAQGILWSSPAIGVDGTILAVSSDPIVLHAIVEKETANGGYAGAPWPQARGNRANTGRAGG